MRNTHAVVIGASMGGLLAARVLRETFDAVTVMERDVLPDAAVARKGVPQGRHGHGLHPRGLQILEELLPGFTAEAVADGAPVFSSAAIRCVIGGHELLRADVGAPLLSTSRPFLEGHLRRRVAALEGVTIVDGCDVQNIDTLDAALVVDATGRGGRARKWLDELGCPRPDEDELRVGLTYATRRIQLPPRALGDDRIVVVSPKPGRLSGMYLAEQEDGWFILTVFGYLGLEPPTDDEGFARFVASVAPADIRRTLMDAEPLSDVVTHKLPSSLRRRYEKLRRFPDGLAVFGDALCSFNPIYGQGMTVAALQAMALRRELARSGTAFDALRFFKAAARPIGDAWDLATGSDLSLPEVPGPRPAKVRMLNAYVDRVLAAAERDPNVSRAFLRVIGMLDRPPALMRPGVMARTRLAA